jgi:hypothetical protein
LTARLEVVPFPFVLALRFVVAAEKVKGSGQECPLHMGLFRLPVLGSVSVFCFNSLASDFSFLSN